MGLTADAYLGQVQALLPPGLAWTREQDAVLTLLLQGLAEELARVDGRADDLVDEADPRTALELLQEWEAVCGYPDECLESGATPQERRAAVVARLTARGGQSRAYFIALAAVPGIFDHYNRVQAVPRRRHCRHRAQRNRKRAPVAGDRARRRRGDSVSRSPSILWAPNWSSIRRWTCWFVFSSGSSPPTPISTGILPKEDDMDYTSSANHSGGQFTAGPPATVFSAEDANALQNELMNIIETGDVTPDSEDHTQVMEALQAMFAPIFSGALLYLTANETITDSTATAIPWDAAEYNTGSAFWAIGDPTKLVIPAGVSLVQLGFNVEWANAATGYRHIYIQKVPALSVGRAGLSVNAVSGQETFQNITHASAASVGGRLFPHLSQAHPGLQPQRRLRPIQLRLAAGPGLKVCPQNIDLTKYSKAALIDVFTQVLAALGPGITARALSVDLEIAEIKARHEDYSRRFKALEPKLARLEGRKGRKAIAEHQRLTLEWNSLVDKEADLGIRLAAVKKARQQAEAETA